MYSLCLRTFSSLPTGDGCNLNKLKTKKSLDSKYKNALYKET